MPSEVAEASVGFLLFVGTLLSFGTANENSGKIPWRIRLFSLLFLLVDIMDVTFDYLFAIKLLRMDGGVDGEDDNGWGALLLIFTSVSCVSILLGKRLLRVVLKKEGRDVLRVICVLEFISYVFEDTTSIMAYARVNGAFDADNMSDKLNICLSVISGILLACGPSRCGLAWCDICHVCRYFKWSYSKSYIYDIATVIMIGIAVFFSYVVFHNILGQVAVEGSLSTALGVAYGLCIIAAFVATVGICGVALAPWANEKSWWLGE